MCPSSWNFCKTPKYTEESVAPQEGSTRTRSPSIKKQKQYNYFIQAASCVACIIRLDEIENVKLFRGSVK
jgi:hypothetical protein